MQTNSNPASVVTEAGRKLRMVKLTYIDSKGKPSIRSVEPYEIKDGKFYGYCLAAQGIRAFKLENIGSCVIDDTTYQPRFEVKL